ncbi:hypothetical protein OEZ85_002699 [Tetradesmus obliquus]|uniref:Protein PAM68, chloroplastic n=1 Tax=Tetradesmus obliquus TaxID=3088 RepID=A0ABY8TYS4_TETOB|nr:hypothetical protein OEZ85_002699 [Tetradesmus obliquus]
MQIQRLAVGQRPTISSRASRTICRPLCAKQKQNKVNKRGKVSSRPGPGSQSSEEAQQLLVQQQQGVSPAEVTAQLEQQKQQQQPQLQPPQQPAAAAAAPQQAGRQAITETPQVVVDRMFKRVLTFAGAPVALGMVLFPVFWYLKVVQKLEYPLWVVYVTQAAMFGGGLLGITYGILSTSWDPRREGSALGWQELKANLPILLSKNKEQQQ